MSPAEKPEGEVDDFEWTVHNETCLFHSLIGNKPTGVNRYFNMVAIVDKFSALINQEVASKVIWNKLETMYNLKILDEIEGWPFPNDTKDFSLPDNEFGYLCKQKSKELDAALREEPEERPPSPTPPSVPRSVSRGAVAKESSTKASKKDHVDKPEKNKSSSSSSTNNSILQSPSADTSGSSNVKADPRRDSKDSNTSSKEGVFSVKTPTVAVTKTPVMKDGKIVKSVGRPTLAATLEKMAMEEYAKSLEDPGSASKRGPKRPLRGSKPEEQPTPPGRRRRI